MKIEEGLVVIRKIHYKCFFIGLFFLVLAALIYLPCKCYVADFYQNIFGVSQETYYNMWIVFVGAIKTILIFFFLVPALAIHLIEYEYKKKSQQAEDEVKN